LLPFLTRPTQYDRPDSNLKTFTRAPIVKTLLRRILTLAR